MTLGENISKLRKERGLTQEQLGKALHISAQAVSKWEKGGSPDAEMLPRIADVFGVTTDTLFGRETREKTDAVDFLQTHLNTFPHNKRMEELFRILCHVFLMTATGTIEQITDLLDYVAELPLAKSFLERQGTEHDASPAWMRSGLVFTEGMMLGVLAKDCPMFLLMPEPEGGYDSLLADDEAYMALFETLSAPHVFSTLHALYRLTHADTHPHTAAAVAKKMKLSEEETAEALAKLAGHGLVTESQIELAEGGVSAYVLHDNGAFVPFLLFARWLMDHRDYWFCFWRERKHPMLQHHPVSDN